MTYKTNIYIVIIWLYAG